MGTTNLTSCTFSSVTTNGCAGGKSISFRIKFIYIIWTSAEDSLQVARLALQVSSVALDWCHLHVPERRVFGPGREVFAGRV